MSKKVKKAGSTQLYMKGGQEAPESKMTEEQLLQHMHNMVIDQFKEAGVYDKMRAEAQSIMDVSKSIKDGMAQIVEDLPEDPKMLKSLLMAALEGPVTFQSHPVVKAQMEILIAPLHALNPEFSQYELEIMMREILGTADCSCDGNCGDDCKCGSDCKCE